MGDPVCTGVHGADRGVLRWWPARDAASSPTRSHTRRPTRLADFLRTDREAILVEWEAFARACAPAGTSIDVTALRDHAGRMLAAIADDDATAQAPGTPRAASPLPK